VQDRAPQRRGARDLRELETQTETGMSQLPELPKMVIAKIENNNGNCGSFGDC
jgi:hypothetical protein